MTEAAKGFTIIVGESAPHHSMQCLPTVDERADRGVKRLLLCLMAWILCAVLLPAAAGGEEAVFVIPSSVDSLSLPAFAEPLTMKTKQTGGIITITLSARADELTALFADGSEALDTGSRTVLLNTNTHRYQIGTTPADALRFVDWYPPKTAVDTVLSEHPEVVSLQLVENKNCLCAYETFRMVGDVAYLMRSGTVLSEHARSGSVNWVEQTVEGSDLFGRGLSGAQAKVHWSINGNWGSYYAVQETEGPDRMPSLAYYPMNVDQWYVSFAEETYPTGPVAAVRADYLPDRAHSLVRYTVTWRLDGGQELQAVYSPEDSLLKAAILVDGVPQWVNGSERFFMTAWMRVEDGSLERENLPALADYAEPPRAAQRR